MLNDRVTSAGRGKPGGDCRRLPACPALGGKRSAATDSDGRSARLNAQQTRRDGCDTSVRPARSASIRPSNGRTTLRRPCVCHCVSPAAFDAAGLRQCVGRLAVVLPCAFCTRCQQRMHSAPSILLVVQRRGWCHPSLGAETGHTLTTHGTPEGWLRMRSGYGRRTGGRTVLALNDMRNGCVRLA